jgi:acyl-CoA thioesterase
VTLKVRRDHLNFNGTCHGGVIFALADTAFGLATRTRTAQWPPASIAHHLPSGSAVGRRARRAAIEITRSRGWACIVWT